MQLLNLNKVNELKPSIPSIYHSISYVRFGLHAVIIFLIAFEVHLAT